MTPFVEYFNVMGLMLSLQYSWVSIHLGRKGLGYIALMPLVTTGTGLIYSCYRINWHRKPLHQREVGWY
jgi:hypothetical protein